MTLRPPGDDVPAVPPGVVARLVRTGPGGSLPTMSGLLAPLDRIERGRAGRTVDPLQASSFAAGRWALRALAAELLRVEPGRLRSDFTCPVCSPAGAADHGRPGYTLDGKRLPLMLSLSRAPGFVLAAALPGREAGSGSGRGPSGLGVDLTALTEVRFTGFDDVALTVREQRTIRDIPTDRRAAARARLWSRKEALAKALGTGFGTGPGSGTRNPGDLDVLDDGRITDLQGIGGVLLAEEGLAAAAAVVR